MGLNNRKENRKMEQTIQLSDHFGYRRLIRFTIPSILMMIFTSIYGVVDGFFVSNFVGKTSFVQILLERYAYSEISGTSILI